MPAIEVRGVNLHYEVYGSGDPVILSHGLLDNCSIWKAQAEIMARRHTVVLYDHRGHGLSGKPRGDYSVRSLTEDLRGLITGLGLERAALVGHSLGGMVALCLAIEHPDLVSKLALVCTTASLLPRMPITGRLMAGMGYLMPYGMFTRKVMRLRVSEPGVDLVSAGPDRTTQTPKHVAYACGKGLLTGYDLRSSVSRVRALTLILAGDKDRGAPVAMSRFLHRRIRGSRLHIIRNCGHIPMLEKPEEFNRILTDFLG